MAQDPSLLEYVRQLLSDDAARTHFAADPGSALAEHGLAHLSGADVHDAIMLAQDTLTVDWSTHFGAGASPGPGGTAFGSGAHPAAPPAPEPATAHAPLPDLHEILFDAPLDDLPQDVPFTPEHGHPDLPPDHPGVPDGGHPA